MFSALSIDKLNNGILDGPQIRKLLKGDDFASHITTAECAAWNSIVVVVKQFLRQTKTANYKGLVQVMLTNFHALEARISIR